MNGIRAALQGPRFAMVRIAAVPIRVAEGDRVQVHEPILADIGEEIHLKKVELIGGEKFTAVGRPTVEGAYVLAEVEEQFQTKTMFMFRKALGRNMGGRWVDPVAQNTILRIKKIVFDPELKIEGKPGEHYKIEQLPAEEAAKLEETEAEINPVLWKKTLANGPIQEEHFRPPLTPEVLSHIRARKQEQIQDLRLHTPGMRYWWWPKERFESGVLSRSR
eukprot:Rhum_TRINITY_DN20823_c0_g2::Rhum_TRINITY_DN20823_c0_g2_i1::g.172302::m.172302/K02888/RP-L21, MRPL21, rplU; large subunit ribosomal protein L21